ncbi:adenylosuccinate lyase [Draconibacterium orientale]|uniref:Adenylosuccinate lyase n=1 Tax=Draconibacterium orientale TaxID=1168034 RepID=X5DIT1_9BACT|nr:adenylosuccinate lyase [Draconibacterium orientale]AHW60422.1 adenylosuccinate lyase [Draconibacterium orientale]SET98769.1 adenylosuccinate lyase [Draconibacterium orientale]
MELNTLTAISPVDGRYSNKVEGLGKYFSEFALIKYRLFTEIEYFIALCEIPLPQLADIHTDKLKKLRELHENFSLEDAQRIKDIESVTNHDVKAVEYFIKDEFDKLELGKYKEFIHFALTSQDANNTAIPKSIQDALEEEYYPLLQELIEKLLMMASEWKDIPMLAKTHGQPASPTKVGKEIKVFLERIMVQLVQLKSIAIDAKFGGATGNFNAHLVAYPDINWEEFANKFLKDKLGLNRSQFTTQISHYDNHSAIFDGLKRINNIILDLDRDIWTYISMNYFKQKIKKGEVGSSTMPHKVNPIDFENSEGNIGIANAGFEQLSQKLPVSRLQRDLTDSTVTRFIGVPFGHTLIAIKSTLKGLNKLLINKEAIEKDLENNWAVVAEAIQTILRREFFPNPYEALKDLTRKNEVINKEAIHNFVDSLAVSDAVKEELKAITPQNYTGIF